MCDDPKKILDTYIRKFTLEDLGKNRIRIRIRINLFWQTSMQFTTTATTNYIQSRTTSINIPH